MKWVRYLALWLCIGSLGCSSDGGPVGTGISSTAAISGNVVDVQTGAAASTSNTLAALPPIEVSIDGFPSVHTVADDNGNFVLSGSFAGSVTMRFTLPQFQVTQLLDVPAGSTVVLQDIELQPDGIVAQAARQLDFFGVVDFVDCSDGTLLIHDRRSGGMQYNVHLTDQSSLVDAAGNSRTCAAIPVGGIVAVDGTIAYATPDATITALVVTLSPLPQPPPQMQLEARFAGALAALDCGTGFAVVDDSVQRTTVQLTARTQFTAGASPTLTCADLHIGDRVRGEGQIVLRMPGVIVANKVDVTGPPSAGEALRFVGVVMSIDCPSGGLQLTDDRTGIDLQLLPDAVIANRAGAPLACADIQPGDRIQGVGRLAADASGTLEAVQILVTHPGLMTAHQR